MDLLEKFLTEGKLSFKYFDLLSRGNHSDDKLRITFVNKVRPSYKADFGFANTKFYLGGIGIVSYFQASLRRGDLMYMYIGDSDKPDENVHEMQYPKKHFEELIIFINFMYEMIEKKIRFNNITMLIKSDIHYYVFNGKNVTKLNSVDVGNVIKAFRDSDSFLFLETSMFDKATTTRYLEVELNVEKCGERISYTVNAK